MARKKSPKKDPYAKREASNYDNPVASRELILEVLEKSGGPLTHEALCSEFQLQDEERVEALRRRLIAMVRDGQLISNRRGAFALVNKLDLVRGRVQGHKEGFGFVIPTDGSNEDVYLSHRQMRKVFSGDEVLVRLGDLDFKGRREGTIVEVLAQNTSQIVGRYFSENGIQFVRPDNPRIGHDILVAPGEQANAKHGQLVSVAITQQPDRRKPPAGRVVEVLGDHLAPGMEIDVAIRSHGIPFIWPQGIEEELNVIADEVTAADKAKRIDLRELPFVTIDGEDARDFDDAVYCESKRGGGWRLFVAIADVSHYVQIDSALDQEALTRGNSVYFPDHVVPMLPEKLSNGLCSLNPGVDRLCMVCEMTISAAGRISGFVFYEAVMHSHARLTYTDVGQVLAEREKGARSGVRKQFHRLLPQLDELHNLYLCLRQEREARGAIDFESHETRIIFDEQRKIKRIVPTVRNDAHKLIEECMLAANVCAARFLAQYELPALYRVHAGPKEEKLQKLREYLKGLGFGFRSRGKVGPQDYQQVLEAVADRPDAHIIQTVMLRSMNQAVYQAQNEGHFGLAYPAYAHFTSPIRRYPDLLVHRAIRSVIYSRTPGKRARRIGTTPKLKKAESYPYNDAQIQSFGEQCSLTERRADDATRDVISWLKCEYLQDHIGEEFLGVVSAVTGFGLFVELKDLYVEGLVHITALPEDYYHFEAAHHRLIGERSRRVFRLGDEMQVRVQSVNLEERKVDFEPVKILGAKKRVKVSARAQEMAAEYDDKQKKKSTRKTSGGKKAVQAKNAPAKKSKKRPTKKNRKKTK